MSDTVRAARPLKIGMIAGEASGDLIGGAILSVLRDRHPDLECRGIGGVRMSEAGCRSLAPIETLSVMGLIEPLRRAPRLLALRRRLIRDFSAEPPDLFIGVDAPDFNLGLEAALRRRGVLTAHCVSPSVWAWRGWRVRKIARSVDLMLTLLPFEVEFYKQHSVPVRYIGHPLADVLAPGDAAAARRRLELPAESPLLALLPGSRAGELGHMGTLFLRAAAACLRRRPQLHLVFAAADAEALRRLRESARAGGVATAPLADSPAVHWTHSRAHDALVAADAALIASGTATLEALLLDCPMAIAYRMDGISFFIANSLLRSRFVGLPNLIAGRELAPELLQKAATAETLSAAALALLNGEGQRQRQAFAPLRDLLRRDAAASAADALLELIESAK